ncbi:hypothetical protein Tco_1453277 [Tanacetum coccineum]
MVLTGPSNILAMRVTDDLIDFNSETSLPKYMKFFFLQQNAKTRHFINIMREEAQTARNCIAQLNTLIAEIEAMGDADDVFDTLMCLKDDIRDENTKLVCLNDVISQAEDKITTKEGHVKIMHADSDAVYGWGWVSFGSSVHGNGYSEKDEKQSQNDKTEHGMEKCEKTKPKSQSSQKVNRKVKQSKSKSTPSKSKSEEI